MDASQSSGIGFDIVMAIVLIATALLGACAPVYLVNQDKMRGGSGRSTLFIVGNMFSGGVMVSAGLCHLLGEALRDMPQTRFPWATFLCGCGFLVTLCADKAASVLSSSSSLHDGHLHHQGGVDDGEMIELTMGRDLAEAYRSSGAHGDDERCDVVETAPVHARGGVVYMMEGDGGGGDDEDERKKLLGEDGILCRTSAAAARDHHQEYHRNAAAAANSHNNANRVDEGCHAHDVILGGNTSAKVSFITAVLMGAALCFHSLLEGAALGAQETIANSMHIFIAIVSHKGLAAYALGSSVIETKVEMKRFWRIIIPFTLASPIGIFIGYFISGMAQGLGAAALSALASGTFLYVAFMEVIPRELMHDSNQVYTKLGALLLGFGLMSLLAIWA